MNEPEQIAAVLQSSPLAAHTDALLKLLEPSIRIGVLSVAADELPLGASRFGGLPDLPRSIAWPHGAVRPLALAAQLRLADLAEFDSAHLLPASGWLYFFIDAADESPFEAVGQRAPAWQVIYFEGDLGQLRRVEPPTDADPRNLFSASALGFAPEMTLPSYGSTQLDAIGLTAEMRDMYEEIVFSLHQPVPLPKGHAVGTVRRLLGKLQHRWIGDPIHRLLGHPEHFQQDPRLDWQRVSEKLPLVTSADPSLRAAARDWQLLLQLDAYEGGPNWLWGDNGTMYFGMRTADLAARRFDQVQWTVECG
jgi:uncharacterized protein YwqG